MAANITLLKPKQIKLNIARKIDPATIAPKLQLFINMLL